VRDEPLTRRQMIGGIGLVGLAISIAPVIAAVSTETVSQQEVDSTMRQQRAVCWCGATGSCPAFPNDTHA
jgi:hypothetical protein